MKILNNTSISIFRSNVLLGMLIICVTSPIKGAYAQDSSCFEKTIIEPSFIAFTTDKESKLAGWYQTTFGLNVVKEFSFPDGTVNGVLMNKGEFVVEVFNRDDALERRDYARTAKPEQWRGVMKFGIYTNANLSTLKQCLNDQGVKAGRIFSDKKLGINLLQVIDPEENVLEIISRSDAP
ncbi:MAG: hypothetical protein JKX81_00305 [Arenicella sp.]|nr:hypothetical protein [Arenicella sp.]